MKSLLVLPLAAALLAAPLFLNPVSGNTAPHERTPQAKPLVNAKKARSKPAGKTGNLRELQNPVGPNDKKPQPTPSPSPTP